MKLKGRIRDLEDHEDHGDQRDNENNGDNIHCDIPVHTTFITLRLLLVSPSLAISAILWS